MLVRSIVYDPDNPFIVVEQIQRIKPCGLRRYKDHIRKNALSYDYNAKVNFIVYEEMEDFEDEV